MAISEEAKRAIISQYPGYEPVGGPCQQGPACAHLVVGYVRQAIGSGRERGWWQCVECDQKFIPSGTVKA